MKKNYLLGYFLVALSLLVVSCNQEEQIIPEADTKTLEPDFFENDGSMNESALEEEAPLEVNTKTYSYYNYTLLKPADVPQEKLDDLCGETKTMPLLVGSRKKKVGEVSITNDDENLYLTFTADDYKYMKKVYVYIGDKGSIPFYSNGYPNLRKFNYKAFPYYFGGMKKATYVVPLSSIDSDCYEIVAYSKIYSQGSRCYYSAFAYDAAKTQTYGYSYYSGCYYYNDWVRSFEYCNQSCTEAPLDVVARKEGGNQTECLNSSFGWSSWFFAYYIQEQTAGWRGYSLMNLYANVSDSCDTSAATEVGIIEVRAVEGGFTFTYVLNDGYTLGEVNLYAGDHVFNETTDTTQSSDYDGTESTSKAMFVPWTGDPNSQIFVSANATVYTAE